MPSRHRKLCCALKWNPARLASGGAFARHRPASPCAGCWASTTSPCSRPDTNFTPTKAGNGSGSPSWAAWVCFSMMPGSRASSMPGYYRPGAGKYAASWKSANARRSTREPFRCCSRSSRPRCSKSSPNCIVWCMLRPPINSTELSTQLSNGSKPNLKPYEPANRPPERRSPSHDG